MTDYGTELLKRQLNGEIFMRLNLTVISETSMDNHDPVAIIIIANPSIIILSLQ